MKLIESREDIQLLVHTFYAEVRKDDLLGPIFNKIIPEDHWPAHLDKLADFWEGALLGVSKFRGNPIKAHQDADAKTGNTIEQVHFARWLHLWFQSIDLFYTGEVARRAKDAARMMSTGQYMAIWSARIDKDENARAVEN